jgi:trk system potassium uptake protein TrkA
MSQQIIIIGLGQFGMSLARTLSEKGAEVLAVDRRKNLVDEASTFVAEAIAVDGTDEAELARLDPRKRDVAVCAIGDESKEASIICTALLRQMGAPWIVARANNAMHQRILQLVGAHLVVNPEQEFGQRFANKLVNQHIISDMPLGDDLHITEIKIQQSMIGKNLVELALPKQFGIMVVAIRRGVPSKILQPSSNDPLQEGDNLIIVSSESALAKLTRRN